PRAHLVVGIPCRVFHERNEDVIEPIRRATEHAPPQTVISTQRLDTLLGDGDQIFDDRCRNVVAVEGGVKRGVVVTGAGVKPVSLQHAVVQRGKCVLVVGKRLVKRPVGVGSIVLVPVCLEQGAVLPVGERDLAAVRQHNRRKLYVGRGQC